MLESGAIVVVVIVMIARLVSINTRGRRAKKSLDVGLTAFHGQDFATAETAFQRVVKLQPIWTPARRMLGVSLARLNRLSEAEEQFQMATKLEPRNGEAYFDLSVFLVAYAGIDRIDDAATALEKAIEFAPALRALASKDKALLRARMHPRIAALISENALKRAGEPSDRPPSTDQC